jgi:hypothetical protein
MQSHRPGERIVILLDGLDALPSFHSHADVGQWLTTQPQLPSNVRVIVTSRGDDPRIDALRIGHCASLREVQIAQSKDLSSDVARLAATALAPPRSQAVASNSLGNFQYVTMMARDAENMAARTTSPLQSHNNLPEGLNAFYARILGTLHEAVASSRTQQPPRWPSLYRPLLGLLAVAYEPMTTRQLQTYVGQTSEALCANALQDLTAVLDRDPAGSFRLAHDSIAYFLTSAKTQRRSPALFCNPATWHIRIAKRAIRAHALQGTWKQAQPYFKRNLAMHASFAGLLPVLAHDPRFLLAMDPDRLLKVLDDRHPATRTITQIFRQVVPTLYDGDETAAADQLRSLAERANLTNVVAKFPI